VFREKDHAHPVVFAAFHEVGNHVFGHVETVGRFKIKREHAAGGVEAEHDVGGFGRQLFRAKAALGPGQRQDQQENGRRAQTSLDQDSHVPLRFFFVGRDALC
jgi:hypothetical protein